MKSRFLETPHFDFELNDDILQITYKGHITLEVAKEVVKKRLEFTQGKPVAVFVRLVDVAEADKEARDFFASDAGSVAVKAGAIYVDSVFYSFLGNFFLKVSKPKVPARIFTDKAKAMDWLKQFK